MLNKDIHIERIAEGSDIIYAIRTDYSSKLPSVTSAEDITLPVTTGNNNSLRVCFAYTSGNNVRTKFSWLTRRNDGSMAFPSFSAAYTSYRLSDVGESNLVKNGFVNLDARTWMFLDTTAFKNHVFTTMNNLLADSLRDEVERERKLQASNKPWHELVNKKYKTKLTKEKVHTINEFFTSDDEWWLSLNDETKAQIRAEWE